VEEPRVTQFLFQSERASWSLSIPSRLRRLDCVP
jgi:hypothetical protein